MGLEAIVTLPESLRDGASYRLAGDPDNGPGETPGFRVLDVERRTPSSLLWLCQSSFILTKQTFTVK